jgi:hypothetical protein
MIIKTLAKMRAQMMRADSKVLRDEAREVLKEALASYEDTHVTIYALRRKTTWNELQTLLAETGHTSHPAEVSTIIEDVESHLESELKSYVIGPQNGRA